jgi:putative ABC transport system permease protein
VEAVTFQAYLSGKDNKHGSSSVENADVAAVSHEFDKIKSFEYQKAVILLNWNRFPGRPIAIIGADVKNSLFPNVEAYGKEIQALGRKLVIVGVFTKEGSSILESSTDNLVVIPVNYARNIMNLKSERLQPMIQVKGSPGITNAELIDELRGHMRSIRRLRPMEEDNFALNESKLLSKQIGSLFDVIGRAGWIIGGFSILVGGSESPISCLFRSGKEPIRLAFKNHLARKTILS